MLRSNIRGIFLKLYNQKGVTLVELLIATTIFLAVVLPMSAIYISGINQYKKTQDLTSLRNEGDFLLSAIMKTVEGTTYFELKELTADTGRKDTLLSILQNEKTGNVIGLTSAELAARKSEFSCGVAAYTLNVLYNNTADRPESLLQRSIYEIDTSTSGGTASAFPYQTPNYIADGLFQLAGNNKLIVYLIIAPKTSQPGFSGTTRLVPDNVSLHAFKDIDEIKKEIDWWQARKTSLGDGRPLEYIKVIRTELAVPNFKKG